jgi:hypothetical protein
MSIATESFVSVKPPEGRCQMHASRWEPCFIPDRLDEGNWLGIVGACPVHGTPLVEVKSDGILSYRCDQPGCRPVDVATALGQHLLAGVLARLSNPRFTPRGIEADCPCCRNPVRVGFRYYLPEGFPLRIEGLHLDDGDVRVLYLSDPETEEQEQVLLDKLSRADADREQARDEYDATEEAWVRARHQFGEKSPEADRAARECEKADQKCQRAFADRVAAEREYHEHLGRTRLRVPAALAQEAEKEAWDAYVSLTDNAEAEAYLARMPRTVFESAKRLLDASKPTVCWCAEVEILEKIGLTERHLRWDSWPEYWAGYEGTSPRRLAAEFPGFPGNTREGASGKTNDVIIDDKWAYGDKGIFQDKRDGCMVGGLFAEWDSPRPLDTEVKVEPFPTAVFHDGLRAFAEEAARVIGCPCDYFCAAMLAVLGVALGSSRQLILKGTDGKGYIEQANIWVALVGPPGSSKTPAMNEVMKPLNGIATLEHDSWQPGGEPLRQPWVADITPEAMARVLRENPKGVLLNRDELMGWVRGMDQYKGGKGSDRQFYLSAWSRQPIHHLRKGEYKDGPLFVPSPYLGVLGGLPTDQLQQLISRETEGDGFLDRILFVLPDDAHVAKWSSEDVSAAAREAWDKTIKELWALPASPVVSVKFSTEGLARWKELYDAHSEEMNDGDLPPHLRNVWSKLRAYAARFTLLLHVLHAGAEAGEVGPQTVERAWQLVTYFKSHARRVYGVLEADLTMRRAKRILDRIRRKKLTTFTKSEVFGSVKNRSLFQKVADLDEPLQLLEAYGHVRRARSGSAGRGRPAERYEVNPAVHS